MRIDATVSKKFLGIGSLASCTIFLLVVLGLLVRNQSRMSLQIDELNRVINRLAKMPANAQDANTAIAMGKEAIRKGQWEVGQLYLVNAVTNSPRNLANLTEYTNTVLDGKDVPLDAIDRLSSVLQIAAYQVDSGDVASVMTLIERVEQSRKRSLVNEGVTGPKQGTDLLTQWERISQVDPNIWKDLPKLSAHIKTLEDFLSTLDEQEDPLPELSTKVATELSRLSEVAQAAKQCGYIDACLERLKKGGDLTSQRSVAIIQAAENALPSFWGLNLSALPPELKVKFDGYPERIQSLVKEIGNARSATILGQIRDILSVDASGGADRRWQAKCEIFDKQLKEAQSLAAQLTSTDALMEAQKLMEKRSSDLRRCRNDQYYEYQKWVIGRGEEAFQRFMGYRFGLSEGDARKVFSDAKLAEVDQSLLTPEVARIFNDVLGKLMAELGPEALVATEKGMGTTIKKKLEDF